MVNTHAVIFRMARRSSVGGPSSEVNISNDTGLHIPERDPFNACCVIESLVGTSALMSLILFSLFFSLHDPFSLFFFFSFDDLKFPSFFRSNLKQHLKTHDNYNGRNSKLLRARGLQDRNRSIQDVKPDITKLRPKL